MPRDGAPPQPRQRSGGRPTEREEVDMTILPRERRSAPSPYRQLGDTVCANPGCDAEPIEGMRIPLCWDCARSAAFQYIADYHVSDGTEPGITERPEPKPLDRERVYFVRLGDRVKIGYSANVNGRMEAVPHEEILAIIPGTRHDEATMHRKFAHLRVVGEWFQDDPSIREFIAAINAA